MNSTSETMIIDGPGDEAKEDTKMVSTSNEVGLRKADGEHGVKIDRKTIKIRVEYRLLVWHIYTK